MNILMFDQWPAFSARASYYVTMTSEHNSDHCSVLRGWPGPLGTGLVLKRPLSYLLQ